MHFATTQITGIALFLFIPLVLVLFVVHPQPIGWSLVAGVALMLSHRLIARPYMERVRLAKCIWCNRILDATGERATVVVGGAHGPLEFVACPRHDRPARRFFAWVDRLRLPLRLGIFLPLLALLTALGFAAFGRGDSALDPTTNAFRLLVGLTVNLAALGPSVGRDSPTARAAFPLHNFTLLGVRNILWIFRLVGIWWIWVGGRGLLLALR